MIIKRIMNESTTTDIDGTISTHCSVQGYDWEVVVATNLVCDLKIVDKIFTKHDWEHGFLGTILPSVLSMLNTAPAEEEWTCPS